MKQRNQDTSPLIAQFRSHCERRVNTKNYKIDELSLPSLIILQFFLNQFFDKKSNSFRPIEGYEVGVYPHQSYLALNMPQFLAEIIVTPNTKNSYSVHDEIQAIHGDKFFRAIIQYEPSELPYIDSISVLMHYLTWEVDIHGIDLRRLENREFTHFAKKFSLESLTDLWRRLTIDECIEYTALSISKLVGQKIQVSQALFPLYDSLLRKFTLGQLFKIIYLCTGFSLRKVQELSVSVLLYQKILVENIQYYTDKVLRENKNIEPFERPRNIPQSGLCKILFHNTLHAQIDPIDLLISQETMRKIINDFSEPEGEDN
jgi:hypothetical protein